MKTLLTLSIALVALVTLPHAAQSSELVRCLDEAPTIFGTSGDDVITGTSEADVIVGLGGNDVIDGGDDGDLICGGPGNDRIQTGPDGGFSLDIASGDDGDDTIVARTAFAFAAYESSPGPVSVDLATGVATGQGTDTLIGINGAIGSEFDDTLRGNSKPNCLGGMGGNDTIETLAGSDCLYGAAGDDVLDGGPGADWAEFDEAPTGVRVNLVTGSATGHGKDRLAGIENVDGSDHSDAITGTAGKNVIDGGKGNDRIAGGRGADRLDGEAGRDKVDGGTGRDKCLGAERKQRCP